MSLVDDLAAGIARFEGFYAAGSLAARNNNPGNLRSWGSYPVVGGYVQFPDAATGWAALRAQVQRNISRGLTLNEFFGGKAGVYSGYAPSSDGNRPAGYAATVAGWLGIPSDRPLSQLQAAAVAAGGSPGSDSGPLELPTDESGAASVAVIAAAGVLLVSLGWLAFS